MRGKTIAPRRRIDTIEREAAIEYPRGIKRPVTRGDCRNEARPCPWVTCRHNLYLDVNPENGSIKLNFPELAPEEMRDSCALDVADAGGSTLEDVGDRMNLTRERVRQVEVIALLKIVSDGSIIDLDEDGPVNRPRRSRIDAPKKLRHQHHRAGDRERSAGAARPPADHPSGDAGDALQGEPDGGADRDARHEGKRAEHDCGARRSEGISFNLRDVEAVQARRSITVADFGYVAPDGTPIAPTTDPNAIGYVAPDGTTAPPAPAPSQVPMVPQLPPTDAGYVAPDGTPI